MCFLSKALKEDYLTRVVGEGAPGQRVQCEQGQKDARIYLGHGYVFSDKLVCVAGMRE